MDNSNVYSSTMFHTTDDQQLSMTDLKEAFERNNNFYNNFIRQDMRKLEQELFPTHEVFATELNPK